MKPERLSRNVIYQSAWVNLYRDKVKFPNGLVIDDFHLVDFPHAAVAAIVENDSGSIVFARICRYATGETNWELPAGRIEAGESILEAAKREVLEETGYTSDNHQLIYSYYPMAGSANILFHLARCRAVQQQQDFDKNEVTEIRWFTRDEVRRMIEDKVVKDGFTLSALLLWLQG